MAAVREDETRDFVGVRVLVRTNVDAANRRANQDVPPRVAGSAQETVEIINRFLDGLFSWAGITPS